MAQERNAEQPISHEELAPDLALSNLEEKIENRSYKVGDTKTDNILALVRENLIELQMRKAYLAIHSKDEDDEELSLSTIMAYMNEEVNKEKINEILSNKEIQKQLNEIEIQGYKTIHSTNNYRDIIWQKNENNSRINEIKDKNGDVIARLNETTHNTRPVIVQLSNGETQQIDNYREVDFPDHLKSGRGPLHLSMAVKDSQGNNIAKSKALYFSAHYDKEGKLIELSSPQPIKFAGKGDDAIGHIERDGRIYTLAVNKGQYKQLMSKVKEHEASLAFNVSQTVEPIVVPVPNNVQMQKQDTRELKNHEREQQQQHAQNQGEQKEEPSQAKSDQPKIDWLGASRTVGQKLIVIGTAVFCAAFIGVMGAWPAAAIVTGSVLAVMAIDTVAVAITKSLFKEAKYLSRFRSSKNTQSEILDRHPNLRVSLKTELYTPKTTDNSKNKPRSGGFLDEHKKEKRVVQSILYRTLDGIGDVASGIVTRNGGKIIPALQNMIAPVDENTDKQVLMSQRREEMRNYIDSEKFHPDALVYNSLYELKKEARLQKIQTLALQKMEKIAEQEVKNGTGKPLDQRDPEELKQIFCDAKNKIEQTEKTILESNKISYNLKQAGKSFFQAHDENSKYNSPEKIKELTPKIKEGAAAHQSQEKKSKSEKTTSPNQNNLKKQVQDTLTEQIKTKRQEPEKSWAAKASHKTKKSEHTH